MTGTLEGSDQGLLKRIVGCLGRERVPYALIGAWALLAWSRSRATADVDFLVLVDDDKWIRLGDRLVLMEMTLDETWLKWNPLIRDSQRRFQFEGVAVDLLRPRDAHDREIFKRKRKQRLDGRYCWLVSAEDFILQKLKVGRPRDFEDALSVLERSGKKLDRRHLQRWANRIGVTGELKYILSL